LADTKTIGSIVVLYMSYLKTSELLMTKETGSYNNLIEFQLHMK